MTTVGVLRRSSAQAGKDRVEHRILATHLRVQPQCLSTNEDDLVPNKGEGGYGMNRAQSYILSVVIIICASVLLPITAKAAPKGSDAKNLHQRRHAIVESGVTALGEERANQVLSQLLPDIQDKQVVILAITYPPGYSGAVHRHHAHAFAYVLDGSVIMGLNDGTPITLSPGQTFYEGPDDIHTISRNASKTQLYTSQNLAIELDGPSMSRKYVYTNVRNSHETVSTKR